MAKEKKPVKEEVNENWIVHKDGKLLKKFKTHTAAKSHAEKNGATVNSSEYYYDKVHKKLSEEAELEEGSFKYHMDKAVAAHDRGDEKKKMYHLGNAKTARYAMKTTDYAKHKDLLDFTKKKIKLKVNVHSISNNIIPWIRFKVNCYYLVLSVSCQTGSILSKREIVYFTGSSVCNCFNYLFSFARIYVEDKESTTTCSE